LDNLAVLLANGDLATVVRARVDRYKTLMAKLQRARPTAEYETLDEIARDQLGTVNANWETAKRLTKEEMRLLKVFRDYHGL
jgi:hypothetical protein